MIILDIQREKHIFAAEIIVKKEDMETNDKQQHVENMEQALVLAEQLLDGKSPVQVLAHQIFAQQQVKDRIGALENVFLCQKEILNFDEAAAYLNMSKSTLYKLTSKKEIPHYKPNRFVFFEKSELDKWIRAAVVKTDGQLNDEANAYTMAHPLHA